MSMMHVEAVREATHFGTTAVLEAIQNMHHSSMRFEELRDAVLRDHRDNHAEILPEFCLEPCKIAAEIW
jgi:hypothetical protein